jgi:hypothetical protein
MHIYSIQCTYTKKSTPAVAWILEYYNLEQLGFRAILIQATKTAALAYANGRLVGTTTALITFRRPHPLWWECPFWTGIATFKIKRHAHFLLVYCQKLYTTYA